MGVYNPDAPQILGQEWVPIRNEDFKFQPDITAQELGYTFTMTAARQLSSARFYVNSLPGNQPADHNAVVNIYPAGQESLSGPIRKVIIPLNSSPGLTGTHGGFNAASTVQEALASPADFKGIFADPSPGPDALSVQFFAYFASNDYSTVLSGKRILNVSLLYSGSASMQSDDGLRVAYRPAPNVNGGNTVLVILQSASGVGLTYGLEVDGPLGSLSGLSNVAPDPFSGNGTQAGQTIARLSLGDISPFPVGSIQSSAWTFGRLQKLDLRNGLDSQIYVLFQIRNGDVQTFPTSAEFLLQYMALEVTYCEETRVATGSTKLLYSSGINLIQMTDLNFNTNPTLPAGDYTATIGFANPGDRAFFGGQTAGPYAGINALREKYAITSMPVVEVDVPFPSYNKVGETFTKKSTHVVPQLTLHTTTAPLTEPHVYGRQAVAQVFGSVTASQNILDGAAGALFSYPQVRYFARRFGSTTVPLTLTGTTSGGLLLTAVSGNNASTPDNAVLDIVGDIDLRADVTPPTTWNPPAEQIIVGKGAVGQRSYHLSLDVTGQVLMNWSADGTNVLFAFSTVPVPVTSGRLAIRATLDVNNGASGRTITFYTAPNINGTWTQLGAPVIQAGVTSIFSGTASAEAGSTNNGVSNVYAGVIHAVQILNGIAGTTVANPDFSAQPAGTTSFVDAAGRTWTLGGSLAVIVAGNTSSSVSITPANFDALDEILDGWRQVDLSFTSAPAMGLGNNPQWTWSAVGERPGNRWEVLGAAAPAVSGTIQNEYNNPGPPSAQLGVGTYGQPLAGTTVELSWMPGIYPAVSGTAADPNSDAVLLFSQNQPVVSGFTVSGASQALTGVGLNCNTYPWYVPSSISYNRLSWSQPAGLILDTFSTPAVSGWSPADTGQAWSPDGATPLASFLVSGGTGKISMGTKNTSYTIDTNLGTPNQDITVFVTPTALVTGPSAFAITEMQVRRTNDSNNYLGRLSFNSSGVVNGTLFRTAGSFTSLGSTPDLPYVDGHTYGLRVSAIGTLIQIKTWDATVNAEPTWWQFSTTDVVVTTGNRLSLATFLATASTNTLPYTFQFDNLTSNVSTFGYYEIQRMDTITDWQTIAHISSPFVSGFQDYEARVGLLSSYRIRGVNSYLFPGPWSSTATLTMTAPGLTGTGMTGTPYVLIFTSNARQDGSRSLAYALTYDGTPTEQFAFPEAGFTQYQFMYNRDFQVAFRPLERGGETFSRTVLVQAAAIAPETLADFKSLRDMAWDSLPYVCVRDQEGNRWFANVTVPTGKVMHKRQLYLADINIIEVTDTSSVTVL